MNSLDSPDIVGTDSSYRVVFSGGIAHGRDPEAVKSDFTKLFKLDSSRSEDFFSGRPVILKKQLNYQSAANLVKALEQRGILCVLESIGPDGPRHGTVSEGLSGERSYAPDFPGTITCPKCGHVQQESEECSRCGIIISKYHQAKSLEGTLSHPVIFYDGAKKRRQLWLLAFLIMVLAFLVHWAWTTREITHPPGILIKSEPLQVMIKNPRPWKVGNRVFVPLAEYSMKARVLSSERYNNDAVADISPIDLALGWEPMSDQSIIDQYEFFQGNRRLVIVPRVGKAPLPFEVENSHSSNNHMIPANDEIKKKIFSVHIGDLIALKGYLVGVQENGQWIWFSSLSRTDTGDGACEIVWVEQVDRMEAGNGD